MIVVAEQIAWKQELVESMSTFTQPHRRRRREPFRKRPTSETSIHLSLEVERKVGLSRLNVPMSLGIHDEIKSSKYLDHVTYLEPVPPRALREIAFAPRYTFFVFWGILKFADFDLPAVARCEASQDFFELRCDPKPGDVHWIHLASYISIVNLVQSTTFRCYH